MDLHGAHVLITGASRGIGRASAHAFTEAGARVALVARSEAAIDEVAGELGGSAYALDLADSASLDGLIARIESEHGPVDVLVNNAGIETTDLVESIDEATIEQVVAVNLAAPMRLARQVLPGMLDRGRGHIVNVSSAAAVVTVPGGSVYCGTKSGLAHFAASLRAELKGTGIGVTTCMLGPVDTSMLGRVVADANFGAVNTRLERLRLVASVSAETVGDDIVDAVRSGRRHVRHPKRLMLGYAIGEVNRRASDLLMAGMAVRR